MTDAATAPAASQTLARRLIDNHPVDAARVMERFGGAAAARVLKQLPVARVATVIDAMTDDIAAECVAGLDSENGASVLRSLDIDTAAVLLRRMNVAERERLLSAMPSSEADQLGRVLAFPSGTAGSLMDPKILSLRDSLTAGEALERVRAAPQLTIYYLYVVDGSSRLTGVLNLRELMLANPSKPLGAVMHTGVDTIPASADRMAILAHPGWTEYHALPVVDSAGRFVGAVRYETLRRLEGQAHTGSPTTSLAVSLGELYWLGLSGILEGLGHAVAMGEPDRPDDHGG